MRASFPEAAVIAGQSPLRAPLRDPGGVNAIGLQGEQDPPRTSVPPWPMLIAAAQVRRDALAPDRRCRLEPATRGSAEGHGAFMPNVAQRRAFSTTSVSCLTSWEWTTGIRSPGWMPTSSLSPRDASLALETTFRGGFLGVRPANGGGRRRIRHPHESAPTQWTRMIRLRVALHVLPRQISHPLAESAQAAVSHGSVSSRCSRSRTLRISEPNGNDSLPRKKRPFSMLPRCAAASWLSMQN